MYCLDCYIIDEIYIYLFIDNLHLSYSHTYTVTNLKL